MKCFILICILMLLSSSSRSRRRWLVLYTQTIVAICSCGHCLLQLEMSYRKIETSTNWKQSKWLHITFKYFKEHLMRSIQCKQLNEDKYARISYWYCLKQIANTRMHKCARIELALCRKFHGWFLSWRCALQERARASVVCVCVCAQHWMWEMGEIVHFSIGIQLRSMLLFTLLLSQIDVFGF